MYASVIVDAPGIDQSFSYGIPDELGDAVHVGACVAVPFAGRELVGYVFEITDAAPDVGEIKDILAVVPNACALSPQLLDLIRWMADRYVTSLASVMRALVPEAMSGTVASVARLVDVSKVSEASPKQKKLVEVLTSMGGEADVDVLKAKSRMDGFGATLRQLRSRGAVDVLRTLELPKAKPRIVRGVEIDESLDVSPDDLERAPKQAAILQELIDAGAAVRQAELLSKTRSSSSPVRSLIGKGIARKVDLKVRRKPMEGVGSIPKRDLQLTTEQADALSMIRECLDSGRPETLLLYGVTASGKTEVYLRSIEHVLAQGKTCIALAPEISLTAHLLDAYRSRFGDRIAVLHSKLSIGERHDEWRRIESGEATVVLGARSAIFAPIANLGLVVVDEEHEGSYKQDHSPRYNAGAVAEERARAAGASVILGSATPSVETFYRASSSLIRQATLLHRIDERPLPRVELVDLREEFEQGRRNVFSEKLQEAIAERLGRREQVILFVNRRGYASFILCRTCGHTERCPNCDVSLTFHVAPRILRCHHCNENRRAPEICPNCGSPHIRQFGIGTERVEEEVRKAFPEASVIRMDSDTTSRKGSHVTLLKTFREGKADILVGTQMIAKGLDFPNVTLVGVISADTVLHLPDFRSPERTFQLLTQVSGRAGRGEIPGEVIVQSFSPDNYAIVAAAAQDYAGFYAQEIEHRRELAYPPFSRLVNLISSDPIDSDAQDRLQVFTHEMMHRLPGESVDVLGPAPAPLAKLKGLYRWHAILRDRGSSDLQAAIRGALDVLPSAIGTGIVIDVDPLTML